MDLIPTAFDLEAFFNKLLNVKNFGAVNYLGHESGDVYLISVAGADGLRYSGRPEGFDFSLFQNRLGLAHNSAFDFGLFKARGIRMPPQYNCTAALSAWSGSGRSLEVAAQHHLGVSVSKNIRTGMKNRDWESLDAEERAALTAYNMRDAELSLALWEKLSPGWPASEQRLSRGTIDQGHYGIVLDISKMHQAMERAKELITEASTQIPWPDPLQSLKQCKAHCTTLGIRAPTSLAEDNEDCTAWEAEFGQEHSFVAAIRKLRKANKLLKKMEAMERRIMPNGRMSYELKYFGAHTGRWAGGGGVNVQNLEKEPWNDIYLRELLIPENGYKFIACDLSQIEPRCLAWVVGDQILLKAVRKGFGVYEAMAISWGLWKGSAGTLKRSDPKLYSLMKSMTLGAGYGCGPDTFMKKCVEVGIFMTLPEAQRRIDLFRARNPLIVRLWQKFDFQLAMRLKHHWATLRLPSGRALHYPNLRRKRKPPVIRISPDGTKTIIPGREGLVATIPTEQGVRDTWLWGGVITENFIQSLARDIFGDALLKLESAGFRVVLHAHDEAVVEVPLDVDPKEIERIMTIGPDWAHGIPLSAEAKELMAYAK
jgi:DNA polymerase bacteriophage-type